MGPACHGQQAPPLPVVRVSQSSRREDVSPVSVVWARVARGYGSVPGREYAPSLVTNGATVFDFLLAVATGSAVAVVGWVAVELERHLL